MDTEDIEKAVEERRVWLQGHLEIAADKFGVEPVGDVINTYDMRSAGARALDHDSEVWLRVVLDDPEYQPACRWEGNVEANVIRGVPKPQVLRWADWHDVSLYRGGGCRLRGEVMTLARGEVIGSGGVLLDDPHLPDSWWNELVQAMTALAAHPVPENDLVDTLGYTARGVQAHFGMSLDPATVDGVIWTTAHADLHWANLTGPELCILDWESWRRAPAGYDAATLYCNSLLHPPTAHRIRHLFQAVLDTHSGQVAMLFALCRYLWVVDEGSAYQHLADPLRALGTHLISTLSR